MINLRSSTTRFERLKTRSRFTKPMLKRRLKRKSQNWNKLKTSIIKRTASMRPCCSICRIRKDYSSNCASASRQYLRIQVIKLNNLAFLQLPYSDCSAASIENRLGNQSEVTDQNIMDCKSYVFFTLLSSNLRLVGNWRNGQWSCQATHCNHWQRGFPCSRHYSSCKWWGQRWCTGARGSARVAHFAISKN